MKCIETAKEVLEFIEEIEANFKPQNWKYKDIDIWPILRVSLYYELTISSINFQLKKPSLYQKIRRLASIIPPIFYQQKVRKKLLLVSDGISYITVDKRLYERFCDPILEIALRLNKDLSWIKWDLLTTLNGKFIFRSLRINSVIDYLLIKNKFNNLNSRLKNEGEIVSLCKYVNAVSLGKLNWSLKSIERKMQNIDAMISFYVKQLTMLEPSLVLIVSFYSDRAMALIYACNKMNITTADIQHGVQGDLHAAYSSWQSIPAKGYNTLPNHFLVWSEDEKESIMKWAENCPAHTAKIIGNLFQEKWLLKSDVLICKFDGEVDDIVKRMKATKNILFTLQYGIHYDDWIFELIAHTQKHFNWLIRLHPLLKDKQSLKSLEDKLKQFQITNFELLKSTELPLYSLLRNVNLHVTHSSSTVIEAANFKIKTILVSNYGAELFESQIRDDMACLINDASTKSKQIILEYVNESFKDNSEIETKYLKPNQLILDYLKKYLC